MCGHLVKSSGRLVPPDLVVIFLALHDSISPNKSAGVHAVGTALATTPETDCWLFQG
jgi:hypothetical protein